MVENRQPHPQLKLTILRFMLLCAALAVTGILPWQATFIAEAQELKNPLAGTPKEIQEGAFLFRSNCALCHGLGAHGGSRGPDLTRGVWNHGGSDAEIFNNILKGIPGTLMPANDLTDVEAWEVVAYLRSLTRVAALQVPGDRQAGEKLFQGDGNCWLCHMVNGKGGRVGPDLSSVGSRRSAEFLAAKIRDPNKNLAPGQTEPGKEWPYDAEAITLVTLDGKTVRGVLRNEDTFSIQIMDLQEDLHSYLKKDLREVTHEGKSLMPPFDEDTLNNVQLRDLVAYLDGLRGPAMAENK
ncbi:MAG TPA: c-type cytochrome [Candidatus Limnocylindria bacterium]|nr:c-type cytochrome [Candidatus Limnocylindria bacterium]